MHNRVLSNLLLRIPLVGPVPWPSSAIVYQYSCTISRLKKNSWYDLRREISLYSCCLKYLWWKSQKFHHQESPDFLRIWEFLEECFTDCNSPSCSLAHFIVTKPHLSWQRVIHYSISQSKTPDLQVPCSMSQK